MLFAKLLLSAQVSEQLAASDVGHQEVEVTCVLGEAFEADLSKE
jgi:hypothetical protein